MASKSNGHNTDFPWTKAIGMYLVSIAMLGIYWYLHHYEIFSSVRSAAGQMDSDDGLQIVAVGGIIEYGLLIGGLTIFIVVSLMTITRPKN